MVQLCGRLVAELDGHRVEDELPSRQGRLLFAYLVPEGYATGSQVQPSNARQAYSGQLVTLRYDQGRLGEVEDAVRDYVERYPLFAAWRCALALVLAETGRPDEAREQFDQIAAAGGFTALPRGTGWLLGLDLAGKAAVAVGGTSHEEDLYDLLLPLEERLVLIGMGTSYAGAVAPTLAGLARRLGRLEDARRHAERAITLAEFTRSPPMLGYARHALAQVLLAQGEGEEAQMHAEGVLALARQLGMTRLAERAEVVVASVSGE